MNKIYNPTPATATVAKVPSVMVQGTSSHAGKSLITAAICRILSDMGLNVAPFKAQNMALNSFVTPDGGEIGRAQALQAEAARCAPSVDMNPVLLKPTGEAVSQVIIHGRVHSTMSASEYHAFKGEAMGFVLESYSRLASEVDAIVIEGAGSPAEINLREGDIANMGLAEAVNAPVLIVGDIDRGGVFASLVGTMELLSETERSRVRGFIINKFRGDRALLSPAIDFLEERTSVPLLGVVPHMEGLHLPEEDSVSLTAKPATKCKGAYRAPGEAVRVGVVRLPRISNFTDFDPLLAEEGVELSYIDGPSGIDGGNVNIVILPGSKNVLSDMAWLGERGLKRAIKGFADSGGRVFGICGGFQMLGRTVKDPYGVEGEARFIEGLGILDVETELMRDKHTYQVRGEVSGSECAGVSIEGYEIHMGETRSNERPFSVITERNGESVSIADGAISEDGLFAGTYIHGIFDSDAFRAGFISSLSETGGEEGVAVSSLFSSVKEDSMARLASEVAASIKMERLLQIIGVGRVSRAGRAR